MHFHTRDDKTVDNSVISDPERSPELSITDKVHDSSVFGGQVKHDGEDAEHIDPTAQAGVQAVEAMTLTWSKRDLYLAYIIVWCIYFVNSLMSTVAGGLAAYVVSDFAAHSLVATTSVVSSIVGGVWSVPLAKVIDIFGRPQGFVLMVFSLCLGLMMMAVCKNVQTYAAAQVFYAVGSSGIIYVLSVFIADTSSLKNRGLAFAFTSSPYLITVWIGGPFSTSFVTPGGPGFRWAFGILVFLELFITAPLAVLFFLNARKAKKLGLVPVQVSGRTFLQSTKYYLIEFDVAGIILLAGGIALFLLPFSLYTRQPDGFKSPMIICMIVFGVVTMCLFAAYEKWLAPKQFIPYQLLMDRTVFGSCVLAMVLFIEFYLWDAYFYSFLQVVYDLNLTHATYIANIYTLGSCSFCFAAGLVVRYTGRYKPMALYFGVPLTMLGVGLMINFRQPDVNIGYVCMCQIFIAVAGAILVIAEEIAIMAATTHQYIAVCLAIQTMSSSIGGAIGDSIAAAIWTGVFPGRLARYLPESELGNLTTIYGDLTVQLSYPAGSETRIAIQRAYGDAQRYMLIAATSVLILALAAVAVWRDIRVKDFKQVKGTVL